MLYIFVEQLSISVDDLPKYEIEEWIQELHVVVEQLSIKFEKVLQED